MTSPTSTIFHSVQDLEGVRLVELLNIWLNLVTVAVLWKVSGVCCLTSFLPELHLDFNDRLRQRICAIVYSCVEYQSIP